MFAQLLSCADNQVAHVQQGTVGTAKQANIEFQIKIVPADGHQSCRLEHAGSPFFGSFSAKSLLARV
jgi:hypothetical protein